MHQSIRLISKSSVVFRLSVFFGLPESKVNHLMGSLKGSNITFPTIKLVEAKLWFDTFSSKLNPAIVRFQADPAESSRIQRHRYSQMGLCATLDRSLKT